MVSATRARRSPRADRICDAHRARNSPIANTSRKDGRRGGELPVATRLWLSVALLMAGPFRTGRRVRCHAGGSADYYTPLLTGVATWRALIVTLGARIRKLI